MSQQLRSQSHSSRAPKQRNTTNDSSAQPPKSATSQQSHDVNLPPSAADQQSSAANQQPPAADIDVEFHVAIDDQLTDTILCNVKKLVRDRNQNVLERNVRDKIRTIESDITEGEAQLENISEMSELLEHITKSLDDGLVACEKLEFLMENESAADEKIKSDIAIVEEFEDKIKKELESGNERESLFCKERDVFETQLSKINAEIDFFISTRDNICSQITELNRIESTMVPTIENFRQSNEQLQQEISLVLVKYEDESDMASSLTENASQWIDEKKQAVATLEFVKSQLKMDKKKVSASFKVEKNVYIECHAEMESLGQECSELESQVAEMENTTESRIKSDEGKFEQKLSSLASALEAATNETKLLKFETDQKKFQFDTLQQMIGGISTLRKNRRALKDKFKCLQEQKWRLEHKIHILENQANVHDRSKRASDNISNASVSKRRRLSPTNSSDSDRSFHASGSSYDMKDIESVAMSSKSVR